jgi:hypothetical protein
VKWEIDYKKWEMKIPKISHFPLFWRIEMSKEKLEYEGYIGTVEYDEKLDFYTGEVEIDGHIYTYEGDTLEELQEDFEDIIDSIIAFDEMDDED